MDGVTTALTLMRPFSCKVPSPAAPLQSLVARRLIRELWQRYRHFARAS
jgi:hypothetical protein